MIKLAGILLFFCFAINSPAQVFMVDYPSSKRKSDDFTINFLTALNDAPNKFSHIKGKLVSKTDSVHLVSQIYQTKVTLPGSTAGRYVQDSTFYLEFFFGEFDNVDDASDGLSQLTAKISKTMNKRVVVLSNDYGNDNNTIKENKIAYALHGGFFHYNMAVQVNKVEKTSNYRLVLQMFSGKPYYYNWIMKNEPIGSFNFVNAVKDAYNLFSAYTSTGCPSEVPPFRCAGTKNINDSICVAYNKIGFDGLPNARSEFDALFSNLRAGLGNDYVYFTLPNRPTELKRLAFIRFDEIDKPKRKTIFLTLAENPNIVQQPQYVSYSQRKNYEMKLLFSY
jgi:hypothetical protein